MENRYMGKKLKPKNEENQKRTVCVIAKVTRGQKQEISQMAKRCGMTVSDYLLSRAYGYKPKERLSEEEKAISTTFKDIRSDIRRFFSVLNGMSEEKRMYFLSNYSHLLEWSKYLMEMTDKISDFLEKVLGDNPIPKEQGKMKNNAKISSIKM